MKSPDTLIALHTKASCVLELLQKAKDRVAHTKAQLRDFEKPYSKRSFWVSVSKDRREDYVNRIVQANRVYTRIKIYYFNLLKSL